MTSEGRALLLWTVVGLLAALFMVEVVRLEMWLFHQEFRGLVRGS